jgi:uncharacterized protein YbjT (DUF2867 family)
VRILVTGASGFVGSLLSRALLEEGHAVRAFGRDPARIEVALDAAVASAPSRRGAQGDGSRLELCVGDALSGVGLAQALAEVDVAYYLIHSMERATDSDSFAERERRAAHNFALAASRAGTKRIVYLGGLAPGGDSSRHVLSRHLISRLEVERTLLGAVPDSIALRASIVIGARSRSFRLLVRLVERMRIVPLPAWQRFRTQPIDSRDVIAMLLAAASPRGPCGTFDVAGPEALTYGEMVRRIADAMLVGRASLNVGVTMSAVTARLAAAIAGEDSELVTALMGSLKGDLLATGEDAGDALNVRLHSFDAAVAHALAEWEATERLAAR